MERSVDHVGSHWDGFKKFTTFTIMSLVALAVAVWVEGMIIGNIANGTFGYNFESFLQGSSFIIAVAVSVTATSPAYYGLREMITSHYVPSWDRTW